MKQINRGRYEVTNGEVVTVKLVATGVGDTALFATAPVASQETAASPRTYEFTSAGNPGDRIFGKITCDFTAADDGANFHAIVSSPDSGPFDGPTINKDDPGSEEPVSLNFDLAGSQ